VPKPIKLLNGIGNGGNGVLMQSTAILWNKWSTFCTFTIYWSLWKTVTGWAPAD